MTSDADNIAGATLTPRMAGPPIAPTPRKRRLADAGTESSDPSVYVRSARALLPRWLRILGSTPWFLHTRHADPTSRVCAHSLYRKQAATLAIALLCEVDRDRQDRPYLRECVRASLIRWQLTLRGDGRPATRRLRRSPLHGVITYHVAQVLSEATGFQTGPLLADLQRHVRWLSRRRAATPWLEAATICALSDSAPLIRDSSLLALARDRLRALLIRQDEEGWFAECGGPDIGRLSLTVDALARLYRQNGWEELEDPLRRMLRFLIHFVHPDGTAGGCYSSCDTAFISPVGVELLATTFDDAAALARLCREWRIDGLTEWLGGLPDGLCATLGAALTMAAANPASHLRQRSTYPYERNHATRFPRAGLSIFSTPGYYAVVSGKKGGAIRVTWREGAAALSDAGVTVVYPHLVRTGAHLDPRTKVCMDDSTVTCSGILRRTDSAATRGQRRIKRLTRRIARLVSVHRSNRYGGQSPQGRIEPSALRRYRRLAHDTYERRMTFGDTWIIVRDRVRCRLPCQTIVCQSATPSRAPFPGDPGPGGSNTRPPIFIDGGKDVEITRLYRNGKLAGPLCHPHRPIPETA